ncbi:MAG: hypothetical protein K2W78_13525 [Xanthobacteraceae bacterium]|nr:hypothetical protein [Xanthobacteraceae bacterium]
MRLSSLLVLCVVFAAVSPAFADTRIFLVASQPNEYGIDQCLASGERCGELAARSYCKAHEFKQASSYHLVDPAEVTGSVPVADGPSTIRGVNYVAITCQR